MESTGLLRFHFRASHENPFLRGFTEMEAKFRLLKNNFRSKSASVRGTTFVLKVFWSEHVKKRYPSSFGHEIPIFGQITEFLILYVRCTAVFKILVQIVKNRKKQYHHHIGSVKKHYSDIFLLKQAIIVFYVSTCNLSISHFLTGSNTAPIQDPSNLKAVSESRVYGL